MPVLGRNPQLDDETFAAFVASAQPQLLRTAYFLTGSQDRARELTQEALCARAPLDASSGEQNRHRLSRAGNRRMNHMIHIAAVTQLRLDTEGRAYYPPESSPKRAMRRETLGCCRNGDKDGLSPTISETGALSTM